VAWTSPTGADERLTAAGGDGFEPSHADFVFASLASYPSPVTIVCSNCGQENPEGFRLCGMCGAPLTTEREAREERKVVTVLFCDLVGSTARAEGLDPEDVRALLSRYHSRVRAELERHGV